ncbi:S41 family peptidase [Ferrimonas pelagia]|uniref:S41 family peptidase n=1 Tax=Ferrimonas pelagia TaxID=1177826 RepID=A0ABP9FE11_9GAMM
MRSYSDDTYLWYSEIFDRDPGPYEVIEYFELLKTTALTPSGAPKDQFHFSMSTEEWDQLSQSGASYGYGMNITIAQGQGITRTVTITFSEPDSPAADADIARGARLISIDGVNIANANDQGSIDILNAGLFPSKAGKQTEFVVRDLGAVADRTVTLTATTVVATPVQNTQVLDTDSGRVGYLQFNSFNSPAERGLFDAFTELSDAQVDDLVIDLRYNGGGLVWLSSQLAYMIAGPEATEDKTYERMSFNDKYPTTNPLTGKMLSPTPFWPTTIGFAPEMLVKGLDLPTLSLERVFILTTAGTCSASEALINGLRGIDVEVILIGGTTCGKPYGYNPTPNCDTTYFTIQFEGMNHKGFGAYSDGFAPSPNPMLPTDVQGCRAGDDLGHALGDVNEGMFSAALAYRQTGTCPLAVSGKVASPAAAAVPFVDEGFMLEDTRPQSQARGNRILTRP